MGELKIEEIENGVIFSVKVVPGSSRTMIAGVLGGMLKVKVAAPAEKGKANKCLIEFLAELLGLRKNAIKIISGLTSPVKTIEITGILPETILQKFNP